jgi:hypothetical protein
LDKRFGAKTFLLPGLYLFGGCKENGVLKNSFGLQFSRFLWRVQAPPKSRRIFRVCLLKRKQLQEHHVQCTSTFPLCSAADADDWHGTVGHSATCLHNFHSSKDILADICNEEDQELAGWVAVFMWPNRNYWLCNNMKMSAHQIGKFFLVTK